MDTNEIYAIFLDIDGTILGSSMEAYEENIATIQRVRALGHKVFLNTGRATSFIPSMINIVSDFDGVISGVGAVSKMHGKILIESFVAYDVVKRYAEFAMRNRLPAVIEADDKMYHFGFSSGVLTEATNIMVGEDWIKLDADNIDEILTPDIRVEKLTMLDRVPTALDDILGDDYVVLRMPHHTEIAQKRYNKGKAMLEVAEILGIAPNHTIAIGDSLNDLDMIKAAGIGIAMENACDELKAASDMIAGNVDSAGVSQILKKLFNL